MKKEGLKIGDKIKLLHVPQVDLDDRSKGEHEEGFISTATILEHIIKHHPIVEITEIDKYGQPWFELDLTINGDTSYHTIAIMDDESWEKLS